MKVLIVNRYMGLYGGAEQVVRELSMCLTRRGIGNSVLTLNISPEVAARCSSMTVITPQRQFAYAFRSRSLRSSLGIFAELIALRRLLERYYRDFDVLSLHNFPASWAAFGLKKPAVWLCNEVPDYYNHPCPSAMVRVFRSAGIAVDRALVNASAGIICAADRMNAELIRQRYGRHAVLTPYGVDPVPEDVVRTDRGGVRARWGIGPEAFVLLQVGVLSPAKNQRDSIGAFGALAEEYPDLYLICAGNDEGPYARGLKELVARKGLQRRVIFTGIVPKEEIYRLYGSCDMGLFPVKVQGGYLAVFEAISCGLPVAVYPEMGAATIVSDNALGMVTHDLARAVLTVRADPSGHKTRALRASAWVRENLTWERFTDQQVEVFQRAIKGERI